MKIKTLINVLSVWAISTSAIAQWEVQNSGLPPSDNPTLIFSAVDADVCWGVQFETLNPLIVRTLDGGTTWELFNFGQELVQASSIFALNADTVWVTTNDLETGTNGGIWKTTDGGEIWVKQQTAFVGPGSHPYTIYFFDAMNGLCTGEIKDGYWEVYTTQDGGENWSRVPSENIPPPVSGDFTRGRVNSGVGNSFWFATAERSIYRTTDKGLTWSVSRDIPSVGGIGSEVAFRDSLNGIVTSFFGERINQISASSDGGVTWTKLLTAPEYPSAYLLSYVPGTAGTYFLASHYNMNHIESSYPGSAYTTDNGQTWTIIDSLPHGQAEFADSTAGWSAGRGDTIFKWTGGGTVGIDDKPVISSRGITLGQNFPNPFNSSTTIQFKIPAASHVVLKVYDVLGAEVATLVDERRSQGMSSVKFGSSDLSSGIYYYRLQVGDYIQTRKLMKF